MLIEFLDMYMFFSSKEVDKVCMFAKNSIELDLLMMFWTPSVLTRLCAVIGMEQLLQSVSGGQVSVPMTIVISGIAKMFVGELVEIGTQHSTYVSLCIPYISLAKRHSHGFFTFKTIFVTTPIDISFKEE